MMASLLIHDPTIPKATTEARSRAGACLGSTCTKAVTIQRKCAWSLQRGDRQVCGVFHK